MNILIVNMHSALNLGDDAIMYETIHTLRRTYPTSRITVAANDPGSWEKYSEVSVLGSLVTWVVDRRGGGWRWQKSRVVLYLPLLTLSAFLFRLGRIRLLFGTLQQRALLSAYYDADLVLSCGGGNFYAYRTVCIAFLWALLCVAFASALGKRIVMLPQSIGPIKGWFQRHLARLMFARADRIMLREQLSVDLLRELRVNVLACLMPDLAFGLPEEPVSLKPDGLAERGSALHIGVTVMDRGAQHKAFTSQRSYEDVVVSVLLKFHQTHGVYLHIFSQCFGPTPDQDDRRCARRVYERLRKQIDAVALHDTFRDALEIKQAYGSMNCMIGTRAHTAVFALSSAIPVVLIGYQPKAYGIMQLFGLEHYCCPIESLTEETLFRLVDEVLINRDSIGSYIAQRYQQIREWLKDWEHHLED